MDFLIKGQGMVFNKTDLEKAIIEKCEALGKTPKEQYTISIREGYASICIGHGHYRIHTLLGNYYFGKAECYHHKDANKLNNIKENLVPLSASEHIKEHNIVQYVSDEYKRNFGNRMALIIRRNDITEDNIKELLKCGYTIPQIAKKMECGENTVRRRLGANY